MISKTYDEGPQERPETTLRIDTSNNIVCFMSNFSFKGDTPYRLITSGGID